MNDLSIMQIALEEAQKGRGLVAPNPLVGAILILDGKIISKGFHGEDGVKHAERIVIEKAQKENIDLSNSTLYLTLEPCTHFGKTPPCVDLIIENKIKKVIIAQRDPNSLASGGIEKLKQAGIKCKLGVLEKEAQYQIRFFRYWIQNKLPYFFGKLAISTDGFYAQDNKNILISSNETKKKTREMRKDFDAILVGKKTILVDNPILEAPDKNLFKIILCRTADFSLKNLEIKKNNLILACQKKTSNCDFSGKIIYYKNLNDFQKQIFDLGIQSVLVEGGGEVLRLFLEHDLIQEFMLVKSKRVILNQGLKMPNLDNFYLFREVDLSDDVLQFFLKN